MFGTSSIETLRCGPHIWQIQDCVNSSKASYQICLHFTSARSTAALRSVFLHGDNFRSLEEGWQENRLFSIFSKPSLSGFCGYWKRTLYQGVGAQSSRASIQPGFLSQEEKQLLPGQFGTVFPDRSENPLGPWPSEPRFQHPRTWMLWLVRVMPVGQDAWPWQTGTSVWWRPGFLDNNEGLVAERDVKPKIKGISHTIAARPTLIWSRYTNFWIRIYLIWITGWFYWSKH